MLYRKEIDGLRAIAIIPVIFYHTFSISYASGGFIGVDIFFVISGYLITNILLKELNEKQTISFKNFFIRRIKRILPILVFITIISIYPAYKLLFPFTFKEYGQSLIGVSTFIPNVVFLLQGGYFAEPDSLKPLLHTWSLGVEEQFYFLYPIFLIVFWKIFNKKIIFIVIILLIFSLILAQDLSDGLYTNFNFLILVSRAWELLAGSLASLYLLSNYKIKSISHNNLLSILGFILIIYSLIIFDETIPHPSFYTLIPVAGAFLLIISADKFTLMGKILSYKFLVNIGLISYSLYLWHFPLFVFSRHFNFMYSDKSHNFYDLSILTYIILIIITFVLSFITWKYLEKPFRDKNISLKKLFGFCGIGLTIIFVTGNYIYQKDGLIERFPSEASFYLEYNNSKSPSNMINPCKESLIKKIKSKVLFKSFQKKIIPDNCSKLGSKKEIPDTVLIGDSFTHGLLSPLNDYLNENKKSIFYDVSSCDVHNFMNNNLCKDIFDFVLNDKNIKNVVLFFRWSHKFHSVNEYNGDFYCGEFKCKDLKQKEYFKIKQFEIEKNFKLQIKKILDSDKTITLLYPLPRIGIDVPNYLAKKVLKNDKVLAFIPFEENEMKNLKTVLFFDNLNDDINRIFTKDLFCNSFVENKCVANYQGKVFYWNKTHLSLDGGWLLLEHLVKNKIF
jgi:peptidoglycan/LPS O-acetylase OafA/YrhL